MGNHFSAKKTGNPQPIFETFDTGEDQGFPWKETFGRVKAWTFQRHRAHAKAAPTLPNKVTLDHPDAINVMFEALMSHGDIATAPLEVEYPPRCEPLAEAEGFADVTLIDQITLITVVDMDHVVIYAGGTYKRMPNELAEAFCEAMFGLMAEPTVKSASKS